MTRFTLALGLGLAAAAHASDFDSANKYLFEQSYSRACDGFNAYLKANKGAALTREATAKRTAACARVGKGNLQELRELADKGEKDYARAYAAYALAERGERTFEQARPLLKQALGGDDRAAKEARQLFLQAAQIELERQSWNRPLVEKLTLEILEVADKPGPKARARFMRANVWLNDSSYAAKGEAEHEELSKGDSDWADDSMYMLGQRRENEGKYSKALEYYDALVKRFSPQTSNQRENAASRAAAIRRPSISLGISYFELTGMKPQVSVSWRNVKEARYTVTRLEPERLGPEDALYGEGRFEKALGQKVSSWNTPLKVSAPFTPGSASFELDVREPGAYLLQVTTDDKVTAQAFAMVTNHVTVAKISRREVLAWVVDAESGKSVPNAELFVSFRDYDQGGFSKKTARTDASGVARIELEGNVRHEVVVWSKANGSYSFARGYANYWSKQVDWLSYAMTDRPLYKPNEKVELKVFLRSREDGPSMPVSGEALTLSIRDPSGKEVAKPSLTTNKFGTAVFTLPLPANAPLGRWNLYVQGTQHSFQQAQAWFQVEEYKPPEYTVSVAPPETLPKPGEALKVKVSASFFFGGPVANASGRAIVTVNGWTHSFKPWPEDQVDQNDPYSQYGLQGGYRKGRRSYDEDDYYGGYGYGWRPQLGRFTLPFKTGADGKADVEVPAIANLQGQTGLSYTLQVFVTDSSRREVQGSGTVNLSTEPDFVDLRPDRFLYRPGERVKVKLRAEDPNGKPTAPEVELKLVKLERGGQPGGTIARAEVKLAQGKGEATLDADALGPVRIEVRRKGAPSESAPIDTHDLWLTSESKPFIPTEAGFFLFTDNAPLKSNDALRVLFVANQEGGDVLVTIETDRTLVAKAVPLNGRARYLELPLNPAMAPNCFLNVFRVENAAQWQTQIPIRVRGAENEMEVAVRLGRASVEPGASLDAEVLVGPNVPKDVELEVAVTTVDEALYAIQPERTDFLSFFGRRMRQQQVSTTSTFNQRSFRPRPKPVAKAEPVKPSTTVPAPEASPAEEAKKEKMGALDDVAGLGGLGTRGAGSGAEMMGAGRMQAAPMAKKMVSAPKGGAKRDEDSESQENDATARGAQEPIKVRENFATTGGFSAQLSGRAAAPVRANLKLSDSLTSWRTTAYVVSDSDRLGIGKATVRTEKPLMVRLQAPRFFTERDEVTLSAVVSSRLPKTEDVEVELSAPGFKALGPSKQKVRVESGKDVRVDVRFAVVEPGVINVRATGRGGGKSDGMEMALTSVVHGSAQRTFHAGRLSDRFGFDLELPEKRKASLTRLELSLSPSLLAVMFDGLPYLAQYPYGCVEQTLSRFVPAAIAQRAVKDLGLPGDRVPPNLSDMVDAGLKRLYDFQHGDGGWGWWQTDSTNKWMSAYVVYGLSLGKEAGLTVRGDVLERGRSYLTQALGGALNEPETHAFMTFALASTGGAPKHALDSAFGYRTRLSPKGRALVALALLHAKDARARIAVENLDDVVKAAKERADAAVGEANDSWSTSQAIEATAWVLMAMVRYDKNSPNVKPLTDFLVLRRNGGKWRTTRDTALAIYALSELARAENASGRSGVFVIQVNGKEVKRVAFAKGGLDLKEPIVLGDAAFKAGKNRVEVRRDGGATGYFGAIWDVYNQNDFIKGVGGDVVVTRSYTMLGKPSTERTAAPTEYGMLVESGVRVRVDLEIKANKAVEFVMIEDLKPAGFEAVLLTSGPAVCNYQCSHAELRTDRVAMFITELRVGVTKLSYELRAEVPGKFAALPARFEAMYAPEIQATSDEYRFEVRDAPVNDVAKQ